MTISREEFLGIIMDVCRRSRKEVVFIDSLLKRRDIGPALKMRLLETKETLLMQEHLIRRLAEMEEKVHDILEKTPEKE